jgi:hypothetical protein
MMLIRGILWGDAVAVLVATRWMIASVMARRIAGAQAVVDR